MRLAAWALCAKPRACGTNWVTAWRSVAFGHAYDATNRRIGQGVSAAGWIIPPSSPLRTGFVANAVNQYTTVGSAHPTYNGNGNLTFDGAMT